jgi:SAM-dependent methyltransferase
MEHYCISCDASTTWNISTTITGYISCIGCNHQRPLAPPSSGGMVNETATFEESHDKNALDRFKLSMLKTIECPTLLDIGCGAGRFLAQAQPTCQRVVGVEITDSARTYATNVRKLIVTKSLTEVTGEFSVITLWHALEHIPDTEIPALFAHIARLSNNQSMLVISVPNGSSWLHRLCKDNDPFVDLVSHTQHFSDGSLDKLLARFGWECTTTVYSSPYATFGWLQGITNFLVSPRNFLYRYLKRGERFPLSSSGHKFRLLASFVCCAVALPIATMMQLAERVYPRRSVVQTKVFRRFLNLAR